MRKVLLLIGVLLLVVLLGALMLPVVASAQASQAATAAPAPIVSTDFGSALAPFLLFFGLCYGFAPAVISVVGQVKDGLRINGWRVWVTAIVFGLIETEGVYYVLKSYGLAVPPLIASLIVGMLVGLHASGLVDLSKYFRAPTVPARK